MAVGLTTRIKLSSETRNVLLHILQTHDSQNPIFQDLMSRLMVNKSLLQEITQEEILTLLVELKRGGRGNRCLPSEAEELLRVLQKAANDFSKAV